MIFSNFFKSKIFIIIFFLGNEYEKANQEEKTLTKRQRGHDFANVTYKIEKSRQSARQMVFDNHKNFFDT